MELLEIRLTVMLGTSLFFPLISREICLLYFTISIINYLHYFTINIQYKRSFKREVMCMFVDSLV